MKKVLCYISVSIITALSANICLAADTNHHYPSLRISSGRMDNPSRPLQMTVLNTSDKTIHLGRLSLSNAAAVQGWKLSHDACSGQALLPQHSCTYSVNSSRNQAGSRVTVMLSAAEINTPVRKDIVIPYPQLKVSGVGNQHTLILKDNKDTQVIQITNTSPYIAIPAVAYRLGDAGFANGQVAIQNSCGKLLSPLAGCSFSIKTGKITPELAGHETPLTITANGNTALSILNLALNDPEQLQFSVAPRQYPAFEDIMVTNTNAKTAKIKYMRMPQGTDMSFKDHPDATDPDPSPVCSYDLKLAANQQCHIWLHAKSGMLNLNPNNFIFKVTYTLAGNRLVEEIDGNNRSVLYLGGTDGNGKPLLAAYNGFAYQSFADLTDNASPNPAFPDGDSVLALATDANGTLYYGGNFSNVENSQTQVETVLNHIGAWSGSDFMALNNNLTVGVNDTVRALSYDSGANVLYLGGDFNDNSSRPMNYIASFYNGEIHSFDKNDTASHYVTSPVYSLVNDGGSKVYLGGDFQVPGVTDHKDGVIQADLNQANPFAYSAMYYGGLYDYSSDITALDSAGAGLYAGSAKLDSNVQYFDGSTWMPLLALNYWSYTPYGSVYSILRLGNQILVGGDFSSIEYDNYYYIPNTVSFAILNTQDSSHIGDWSSNTSAMSSSGDPIVYSMIADNTSGLVYIAGHFDSIDNGINADNLAIYDPVHNSFAGISNSPFTNGAVKAMALGSVINVTNL